MTERKGFFHTITPLLKEASRMFILERTSGYPFLMISEAEAIRSYWEKVGGDIRQATEKIAQENTVKETGGQ